jgi:hypothetical protein
MRPDVDAFPHVEHEADLCVVGGGMTGLAAALAAARHGAQVVLMQDRPVLGGNASSECRVHICGADRHNSIKYMRETGILEELRLTNLYRNPNKNFSIWDTILYEAVMAEPNITLLLNCSCCAAEMATAPSAEVSGHIASVSGWQLTTETVHTVRARLFADCSGDGVLAPLTGAAFRMGREARDTYGEPIAPEVADDHTMGMTCLFQSREYATPQPFEPLPWAHRYDRCDELPYGARGHRWWEMGYWWIELGGQAHSIHDTERLRDKLLKVAYGVWDHIKNRCPHQREAAANWAIAWVQFLPAKRESRRYIGDHVLTQLDIEAEGRFDDIVAYGGWSMDDHHPAGFDAVKLGAPATIFHPAPSPYGIPYRSLYSRNVDNLMFAGRDASCSHAAMSSTRVMGTCMTMGQAVGTAAAMAVQRGLLPREVNDHIDALQQTLLDDDSYLPWVRQAYPPLTAEARLTASQGDPEPVRDGVNRPVGDWMHRWACRPGDSLTYRFGGPQPVTHATLILDSGLDQNVAMSYHQRDDQLTHVPAVVPQAFRIEGLRDGTWQVVERVTDNYRRHRRFPIGETLEGLRFVLEDTWGADTTHVYAFYLT